MKMVELKLKWQQSGIVPFMQVLFFESVLITFLSQNWHIGHIAKQLISLCRNITIKKSQIL